MNVVEAYIKYKGQLVIYVSGISGCGKTMLSKNISQDFKIDMLDQFNYYKKDYNNKVKLPDDTELTNWETDEAVDWDKFNKDIASKMSLGVIVSGFSLPADKMKINPDFHIHLTMNKQKCLEKRRAFLEKNKDIYKSEYNLINTQTEKLKMNQLIYPYYLSSKEKSVINKFVNMNKLSDEEAYDDVFGYLIANIEKFLYKDMKKLSKSSDESQMESVGSNRTDESKDEDLSEEKSEELSEDEELSEEESEKLSEESSDELSDESKLTEESESTDDFDNEIKDGPIGFLAMDEQ